MRMSVNTVDFILKKIKYRICKKATHFNKHPTIPAERLMITIR